MSSLEAQLRQVKLKTSDEPTKDYSSPKLAGFLSAQEIYDYQHAVLEVNTEAWLDILREETFPSCYCPLFLEEANLFISVYERHFQDVDPQRVGKVEWQTSLSKSEKDTLDKMAARLQVAMETFTSDGGHVFVKTSSRSAKDAPLYQEQFTDLYKTELSRLNAEDRREENQQITCLLRAAFEAMKVHTSADVIDMFICSERIYQDMLLAVQHEERFCEHFVIRKFVHIDVDMEFRGFVFGQQLRAVSQYNYLIYSDRLVNEKDGIMQMLLKFFDQEIQPKFKDAKFPDNYVIDFAVCENGKYSTCKKIWAIEINPFLETTDGALFSWQHERHILEGKEGFVSRITTRPKPGATAALPYHIKAILKSISKD